MSARLKIVDGEELWTCGRCHEALPRDQFYGESSPDAWCIPCNSEYQKARRAEVREEPNPTSEPLEQMRRVARDRGVTLSACLAEAIGDWLRKQDAVVVVLVVLLIGSVAQADMAQIFVSGDSLIVDFEGPVPPGVITTSNANPGAIIDFVHYGASLDYLTGGLYFPIGTDDHGWLYAPPITPTTAGPSPWCFEISTGGDGAQWMVNALGKPHDGFTPVGTVIGDTDWLEHIADHGLSDAFGLHSVPLDAAGQPYTIGPIYQYAIVTLPASPAPAILPAPEPATLLLTVPALLLLRTR